MKMLRQFSNRWLLVTGAAVLAVAVGSAAAQAASTAIASASVDAAGVCGVQSQAAGPDFTVAGSFATTVGAVRSIGPRGPNLSLWPTLDNATAATLCYLDGSVAKAPPAGKPFDRVVIAIADGDAQMVMAGYQDRLQVKAP